MPKWWKLFNCVVVIHFTYVTSLPSSEDVTLILSHLHNVSVTGNTDRSLCNEWASSACSKLLPDMTIQWRTMERTSLSFTHLGPLTEGIQPSPTANHSTTPWKVLPLARRTAAPLKRQHARQMEISAPTSLDHLPNPGDPSLAKATLWRTQWEQGGWETVRRAWVIRPRPDHRQIPSEMTRWAPLPLETSRTPMADATLLYRLDLVSSGTEAAVCPSTRRDHAASKTMAPSTVSDPPRCAYLRCGTQVPCLRWKWTLRRPVWGQLIGLTRIVWITLRWLERGRNSTGTWVTVGSWRAWVPIVPQWAPSDPPTVFLAPLDPRMWGTGIAVDAEVWSHIFFRIDLVVVTRLSWEFLFTNSCFVCFQEFSRGQSSGRWCLAGLRGAWPLLPRQETGCLRHHVEHAGREGSSWKLSSGPSFQILGSIKVSLTLRAFRTTWTISSFQQTLNLHKMFTLLGSRKAVLTGSIRVLRSDQMCCVHNLVKLSLLCICTQEGVGNPSAGDTGSSLRHALRSRTWRFVSNCVCAKGSHLVLLRSVFCTVQ